MFPPPQPARSPTSTQGIAIAEYVAEDLTKEVAHNSISKQSPHNVITPPPYGKTMGQVQTNNPLEYRLALTCLVSGL